MTEIGNYAFCQCAGLTRVQLPAALETLGTGAFYACTGLAALSIPKKVTYLSAYTCYQCTGLQSVSLPDGVSAIGERAFYNCSALTQIVLPQTVSSIGEYAFYSCENLTQITIPENVSYIWERAFAYCESLQSISLGNRLTYVDDGVFAACYSLTSVVIPDSVTAIRDSAFSSCENLISVVISENVASIGSSAFGYCEKLRAITFGGYPATIFDSAFTEVSATAYYPAQNSNWTAQTMRNYGGTLTWTAYQVGEETVIASGSCGDDVKWTLGIYGTLHISGTGAMSDGYIWQKEESGEQYRNLVRNVVISQGVTTIGSGAFNSCNLTGVTIPDTVTKIGDRAFAYCDSLTQIVIPDSVTTIGDSAFYFCDRLTQVTLPANLTAIGQQMFYGCKSLTCLTVPGLVKTIGEAAFCQCESLTEISISAAVTDIAAGAFAGCKNLQTIVVDEKNTTYYTDKAGVLLTRDQKQLLLAPVTIKTYVVPDGVQRIADHAFAERKQMTSVTLPVSMKNIGRSAFARCTQLKTMYYYGSKQQWSGVGKQTDWDADSFYLQLCMDNPSRGLAMKLSEDESFYTVTGMGTCTDTQIRIPMAENNIPVTQIAPKAFANQRGITKVVIPESVTKIGASAFAGCDDLEQISYQGTQEQWQSVELGTNWADASVRDVVIDEALSGDFTGDEAVNNEDVAYLLWYTLFPEDYPVTGKADFTGDGAVNNEDVAYLLWHTLFPEDYPL